MEVLARVSIHIVAALAMDGVCLTASAANRVSSRLITLPTARPNTDRDHDAREAVDPSAIRLPAWSTKAPMPYCAPIISALDDEQQGHREAVMRKPARIAGRRARPDHLAHNGGRRAR
ncbi:hypothetical protein BRDID11002_15250 [Bradyrhizobium diazoefficiens]